MTVNNELERKWNETVTLKFNKPPWCYPGQTQRKEIDRDTERTTTSVRILPKTRFKSRTPPNTYQQLNKLVQFDEYMPIITIYKI